MSLEVEDVVKHYDGVVALDGVSASFERGRITGIVGPNGSGKSTLFDVITGVVQRDSGVIRLNNEEVDTRRIEVVASSGLIRTYQIPRVVGAMTVLENLMVIPREGDSERISRLMSPLSWRRIRSEEHARLARARGLLQLLSMTHMADELAETLSGGQKKLLSFAASLMADPEVLLLDEPTAGVNPVVVRTVQELLIERRALGRTTILIEHNLRVVSYLCDIVYVLDAGRVIAKGDPEAIKSNPEVVSAYLGRREATS